MEIDPGRSKGADVEAAQSPAASAASTSLRWNHRASAISPSVKASDASGSARAAKPIMMDRGNGQG